MNLVYIIFKWCLLFCNWKVSHFNLWCVSFHWCRWIITMSLYRYCKHIVSSSCWIKCLSNLSCKNIILSPSHRRFFKPIHIFNWSKCFISQMWKHQISIIECSIIIVYCMSWITKFLKVIGHRLTYLGFHNCSIWIFTWSKIININSCLYFKLCITCSCSKAWNWEISWRTFRYKFLIIRQRILW